MALDLNNFKETDGPGNSQGGGQTYSVFSTTDTLGTMMASGYLNLLAFKLNVRDTILISGSDFTQLARVNTNSAGVVTVAATSGSSGVAGTLSGPGALSLLFRSNDVITTGADAVTLADGFIGQFMNVTLVVDGGTMILTPANGLGYSTVTFADAGDSVQLEFKSGGWAVIGQGGLSTGPVVA